MVRKYKYRLLGEQKECAERLLHQQLSLLGRDIESKHGNLLITYGCFRQPSTMQSIPSYYSFPIAKSRRICFRNFGVFVCDDLIGSIYLSRKDFVPRLLRSNRLDRIPWLPRQIPPSRLPRSPADRVTTATLLHRFADWCYHYEAWVQSSFGRRYRTGQLVRFKMRNNMVWKWNMVEGWQTILDWLEN